MTLFSKKIVQTSDRSESANRKEIGQKSGSIILSNQIEPSVFVTINGSAGKPYLEMYTYAKIKIEELSYWLFCVI